MALFSLSIEELRARQSLKWRTYDPDVLPLWVAEMDTTMPEPAKAALLDAVERGDTGYPHGTAYAEAFARMASDRWGWQVDAAAQVRRAGDVMNSVLAVLEATSAQGEAVVINPPVYPPFRQVIAGYKRRIVEAPLDPVGRLDLATLEAAFAGPEQPKTYLLCSPHNPTGAVHTEAELTAVMALATRFGVRVVVDEIHACLVDPGTTFVPLLTVPGGEQAISVTSAGKAWNLAGFKAGLIVAGAAVTGVLADLPPLAQQSSGHLANLVHTAAITDAQDWIDQLVAEIADNKALLASELARLVPAAGYIPAEGTYLAWVDCSHLGLANPAHDFLRTGRVAFSPGVNFGVEHRDWVRINLACSPDVVVEAVARMAKTLNG